MTLDELIALCEEQIAELKKTRKQSCDERERLGCMAEAGGIGFVLSRLRQLKAAQ